MYSILTSLVNDYSQEFLSDIPNLKSRDTTNNPHFTDTLCSGRWCWHPSSSLAISFRYLSTCKPKPVNSDYCALSFILFHEKLGLTIFGVLIQFADKAIN